MILGITGTVGAGKGAAVNYLVNEKGFTHYSVRNLLIEKMNKAGIAVNRDTMIDFANELRTLYGPKYLFNELYSRAEAHDGNVVIESIRALGEANELKSKGGILIAIDANQAIRFERIRGRGSELDNVTLDEFMRQENRELHSDDPNKQNVTAVMALADFTINNNASIGELHKGLDDILTPLERGN